MSSTAIYGRIRNCLQFATVAECRLSLMNSLAELIVLLWNTRTHAAHILESRVILLGSDGGIVRSHCLSLTRARTHSSRWRHTSFSIQLDTTRPSRLHSTLCQSVELEGIELDGKGLNGNEQKGKGGNIRRRFSFSF